MRRPSFTSTKQLKPHRARMATWRRRAAVSLLVGTLCTVASAWVCVFLPDPQWRPTATVFKFASADETPAWDVQVRRAPWFTSVMQMEPPTGDEPGFRDQSWPTEDRMPSLRQQLPGWAATMVFRAPTPDDLSKGRVVVQVGLGWPLRSMYARATGLSGGPPAESALPLDLRHYYGPPLETVQGIDLRRFFGGALDEDGHMKHYRPSSTLFPLRPICTGFAANTGLFALVVFAPWSSAVGLLLWRRSHRLALGLCPYCCYPLTGNGPCPECGRVSPHDPQAAGVAACSDAIVPP
jgi:hypothetical protein